jgi:PHD/YefM family antitoxin component YafN of YafNO toxin-antitoxin module
MNTLAANELKRHGMSAIERCLRDGPVHIIKRNRPVCVVLAEADYRQLQEAAEAARSNRTGSVMEWFASYVPGTATKEQLDEQLDAEREVRLI